jgi:hypothetical protein
MNQALYAHMNNKRKMKKKNKVSVERQKTQNIQQSIEDHSQKSSTI